MDQLAVIRDQGCKAKIPNFYLFVLIAKQDVRRLQVAMHYSIGMKKVQAQDNLLKDSKGLSKFYILPLPQEAMQACLTKLHLYVKRVYLD